MYFTPTLTQHIAAAQLMLEWTGKAVEAQLRFSQGLIAATLPKGDDAKPALKSVPAHTAKPTKATPARRSPAKLTAVKTQAEPPRKAVADEAGKAPTEDKPVKAAAPAPKAKDQMRRRKARKAPSMPPALPGIK